MKDSHSSSPAISVSTKKSGYRQVALAFASGLGPLHAVLSTTIMALAAQSSLPSQRQDALHTSVSTRVNNAASVKGMGTSSSSSSSSLLCGLLRASGSL